MDKNFSNSNIELIIDKATADQLVDRARSFRRQCVKAVKDMQDAHIEKIKKKKGLKDVDDDSEESKRWLAEYISIMRNHSQKGWFPPPYDPNQLITLFPCLHIKEGYHLGSYQVLDTNGNGRAIIFVIPKTRTLPKKPPQKVLNDLVFNDTHDVSDNVPKWGAIRRKVFHHLIGIAFPSYRSLPKWADGNIENYIEGDGSPLSYFHASIFFRELYELGAMWHNVYWGHYKLVTSPNDLYDGKWIFPLPAPEEWTWNEPEPKEWRPVVWKDENQKWNVTFYTINEMYADLNFHKDTFITGYKLRTARTIIAHYPGGYEV
jgi:hypothetical protein